MMTKILIEFEVEGSEEELTEDQAKSAASLAAYNFLTFCEISGYSRRDIDEVPVHVDGYGECTVRLGEDHD